MRKFAWTALAAVLALTGAAPATYAAPPAANASEEATEAQRVIDKAVVTVQRLRTEHNFISEIEPKMRRAKAVLIVPSLVKAGFILGAEIGSGVLLVRGEEGPFGQPAFFKVIAGSIGIQLGVQDSEVMFLIMSEKGLNSVLNDRFKASADLSLAVIRGGGIEAGTTSNIGADIYAFSVNYGLFGGGSFEGASIQPVVVWNNHYYGDINANPRSIMFDRRFYNSGSEELRRVLDR